MKVLISAYACEPSKGSEPEVGFRTVLAAARHHDVWVITRENNVQSLRTALKRDPAGASVRVVGFEHDSWILHAKKWARPLLHLYYDRWQRGVAPIATQLDAHVDFDLVHHVTFSSYYGRVGVAAVDKPLVLGPLGGAVRVPLLLLPLLRFRGLVSYVARSVLHGVSYARPSVRDVVARAQVVLVQNPGTYRRLGRVDSVIFPNAASVDLEWSMQGPVRDVDVAFVGRLIPFKAGSLAVRAMRYVSDDRVTLTVFGSGNQRRHLERLVKRWGLGDRVRLVGGVDRTELFDRIAGSVALLHPSLHEDAGLAVAEALTLGTPVICLDNGGPPVLIDRWATPGVKVRPASPKLTARRLARAIGEFVANPAPASMEPVKPTPEYEEGLMDLYDRAAGSAAAIGL